MIDFGSKVNVMSLVYTVKLDIITRKTSVGTKQINSLILKTYNKLLAGFLL